MRRGTLLSLLILTAILFTPVTVTAADQVLNEWLYWDGNTTVDDHPVNVQLARNDEILRVDFLNQSTVTQKGGCGEINVYNFCFEETSEEENPDIDGEGQLRPGVKLKAYKEDITTVTDTGSPTMDISTNSTSLGVTEQQKIIVKFQNTGDGAMFNFSASITPYNLTHKAGDDEDLVTVGDDTYKKTGGVEAGDNTTIPLTVSLNGFKPRLKATYAYDTSNGSSVTGTENITLQTETFYDVTLDAPNNASLYDAQTVTLTVENNATTELAMNTTMTHKGNQLFEPPEDTERTIDSGKETTFTGTYVPRYQGTGGIVTKTRLDWGLNATETRNATINTRAPDVDVNAFIERTNAGEDTQTNITIENKESMMLYNPTATIRTPFGDIVKTLAQNITFDTSEKYTVPIKLPYGIEPRAYDAEIIVRYTTKSNEQFKHEIDNSLIIEPVAYDVQLNKTFSDTSPRLNETVHVEVYAENIGIEALNDLTVEETTTPTVYENTTEIDLEADARLRILEYNVSYNGTPITTTTRTDDDRLSVITTKTIDGEAPPADQRNQTAVLPGATNETEERQPVQPRNPPRQNQTDDEPDSASGRIWSFLNDITSSIEDFFSSLV